MSPTVVYPDPAGEGSLELSRIFGVDRGDADVLAENLIDANPKKKFTTLKSADLKEAITGIQISDTIHGSSTLTIKIHDPKWQLVETGFFDVNEDGKLDRIDIEYPDNSNLWWRVTQVGINATRSGAEITLTLMERVAAMLVNKKGPTKARRGKGVTRAQFIKSLVDQLSPKPAFHCHQLTKPQKEAGQGGDRVFYVGDSLGVGTVPPLKKKIPGRVFADVQVGRSASAALAIAKKKLTSDFGVVVFDAGTNDDPALTSAYRTTLDAMLAEADGRPLVIASLNRGDADVTGMNAEIHDFADDNDNVRVVAWASDGDPYLGPDGTHPTAAGYEARADMFAEQIDLDPHAGLLIPAAGGDRPSLGTQPQRDPKEKGLPTGSDCTVGGKKITPHQAKICRGILGVADNLNAPTKAVEAMMCAAIGESTINEKIINSIGYGGVFQGDVTANTHVWEHNYTDYEAMATCFLKGGKGFQGGGAIDQAKKYPDKHPGLIAADVEKSYPAPGLPDAAAAQKFYGDHLPEAKKIIQDFGGAGGGTSGDKGHYEDKPFNFEVKRGESYWSAITGLADEVKWAVFVDGEHVFYEAETTLITQQPAMIVRRRDPAVISFDCNWDVRKIATEATLELICSPFEFRAGDVLLLDGFGPGSSGSTATPPLPGRWLVSDISRDRYALSSRVTLVQPTKPGKEPAHDREWKEADESSGPSSEIYTDAGGVWVGEFQSSNNFGEPNHGSPPHVHHGLDVSVPSGTKCIAPFDGTVVHTSTSGFGVAGGMFLMQTNRNQAGLSKGDKVGWGHVSECKFKPGDHVKKGQVVAISNGNPPHVHFVLQKKNGGTLHDFGIDGNADPSAFLRAIGSIPGGAAGYTKGAGKPD